MKSRFKVRGSRFEKKQIVADGEDGYILLAAVVATAIILILLSVAAAKTAFTLREERERESARRADQYVRAIRRFYLKNRRYPTGIEQLENLNLQRFLRQRYVDPLTGKQDYRLIQVGQNQTTVKGFFGQELQGIAGAGLGAAAGMQSNVGPGATTMPGSGGSPFGSSSFGSQGGGGMGAVSAGGGATAGGAAGTAGAPGATDTSGGAQGAGGASGLGSAAGMQSNITGSTGPIMGVGSSASGASILTINDQTTYETWEFLYDPRLEQLRLAGQMNSGAGLGSAAAGALGTTPGSPGTPGAQGAPGAFGSPPGGFGSSSAGGAGAGGAGAGSTPTTQP